MIVAKLSLQEAIPKNNFGIYLTLIRLLYLQILKQLIRALHVNIEQNGQNII